MPNFYFLISSSPRINMTFLFSIKESNLYVDTFIDNSQYFFSSLKETPAWLKASSLKK